MLLPQEDRAGRGGEAPPVRCAPPRRFRSAEGVLRAWPSGAGPFSSTPSLRGKSAAQKAGIRYERKIISELISEYPDGLRPGQWFRFEDASGLRWCQVDALRVEPQRAIVFEVKSRFSSDAWWQLRKLYEPVVRLAFKVPVVPVVICRNFDPWAQFPEAYSVIHKLSSIQPDVLNVLPWRL